MRAINSNFNKNPQYLNHMNEIKFLHVFLCFNLPLIVFMAHDVPSKWDLLKVLIVCNQGCESDAETRRGTRVILGVTNDRREGKNKKKQSTPLKSCVSAVLPSTASAVMEASGAAACSMRSSPTSIPPEAVQGVMLHSLIIWEAVFLSVLIYLFIEKVQVQNKM